jgi:hypothetical protein
MQNRSRARGDVRDLSGFVGVDRERLFYEGVLASRQREECAVEVAGVGGSDVDDVDVGVGHQVLVGRVGPGDGEPAGEPGGGFVIAGADGHDLLTGVGLQ